MVERLSSDLRKEFPGESGFSAQNLWYMRQFYLEYKDYKNLQQLVGEIPWGQNLLNDFVKEPDENPAIGIILCGNRNRMEVEYALKGIDKPVGVAQYVLTRKLPSEFAGKLPKPEYLEKQIMQELGKDDITCR